MMRPCLVCSKLSEASRCPDHTVDDRGSAASRGYDTTWTRLSKRARKLQPFCSVCGTTDDLTADHKPEAWQRRAAGQVIRLVDVDVLCRSHNAAKGAAR